MREQLVQLLNQHPSILGMIFVAAGGWELWQAVFRYEAYKKWIARKLRQRWWLAFFGFREPQPRPIAIAAASFILVMGLALIDFEIRWVPRLFWAVPLLIALLSLVITLVVVKWKLWQRER